ncbi:MAG: hypothetical protein IJ982_10715, partial [Fibrobacter sp.]|nr:hypothetical protein [Fibrobacter sp.]
VKSLNLDYVFQQNDVAELLENANVIRETIIENFKNGNISSFDAARIAEERANSQRSGVSANQQSAQNAQISQNPAKKKKRSYNEEREYAALPDKIEKLEAEIAGFQAELAKPEVYTDAKRIVELQKEIADRESELEKAYERYEELDLLGG